MMRILRKNKYQKKGFIKIKLKLLNLCEQDLHFSEDEISFTMCAALVFLASV